MLETVEDIKTPQDILVSPFVLTTKVSFIETKIIMEKPWLGSVISHQHTAYLEI